MFRSINGFEGKYSISPNGVIFSHKRKDSVGRIQGGDVLRGSLDKDGYLRVTFSLGKRGESKVLLVSRLVAETYLPNSLNKPVVNHKDGNKLNNHMDNLEWCSHKENTIHAWKTGLCTSYDRSLPYNRSGIIESNKNRRRWFGTHKEYCKKYYEEHKLNKKGLNLSE